MSHMTNISVSYRSYSSCHFCDAAMWYMDTFYSVVFVGVCVYVRVYIVEEKDACTQRAKRQHMVRYVTVCCSVLQCVAVCCSVLRCVAVCGSVPQHAECEHQHIDLVPGLPPCYT